MQTKDAGFTLDSARVVWCLESELEDVAFQLVTSYQSVFGQKELKEPCEYEGGIRNQHH